MQVEDNKLSSFRDHFEKAMLKTEYAEREIRPLFKMLCEDLLDLSSSQIMLARDTLLTESQILLLLQASKELKKGRPIQYIIGRTEFAGLSILCDERALIPRPETEELVRWISDSHHSLGSILDIGTGTGCIALALKDHFDTAEVEAMDVEADAISLSQQNSEALGLKIELHVEDILEPRSTYPHYDLIVSNPPYVRGSESKEMRSNVLDHEPHSALFVDDSDPLLFYRSIFSFAKAGSLCY